MVKKLSDAEALRLAAFIVRIGRPTNADDQALMVHWVRRLEGGKS